MFDLSHQLRLAFGLCHLGESMTTKGNLAASSSLLVCGRLWGSGCDRRLRERYPSLIGCEAWNTNIVITFWICKAMSKDASSNRQWVTQMKLQILHFEGIAASMPG